MQGNRDIEEIVLIMHDGDKYEIDGILDEIIDVRLDKKMNAWVVETENHDYIFDRNSTKYLSVAYREDY